MSIVIEGPLTGCGAECEAIMGRLPDWFGLEQALLDMAKDADRGPTFLARDAREGTLVGFVTTRRHFPPSAELLVMAVRADHHRRGIGAALVRAAEQWLCGQGVELLQVKTLGPSRACEHYARTRAFYTAMGFRPLEEMKALWDERNPCLVMVKGIRPG